MFLFICFLDANSGHTPVGARSPEAHIAYIRTERGPNGEVDRQVDEAN
jgi:hypothetical protein